MLMRNNPESFWSSRDDAVSRLVKDPNLAVFDFKRTLGDRDEFKKCQINHIPKR